MSAKKKKPGVGSKALSVVRQYFPGVTSVVDSSKGADIEVTGPDNKNSVSLDHSNCALAVACKRVLKADGVLVGTTTCYVIYGHRAVRYKLQESTSREIVSFDRHAGFYAGIYSLRAPSPQEQLGAKPHSGKEGVSGFRKPKFRHVTGGIRTILGNRTETA